MEPMAQFQILGISLVLGLLVGLQREVTHARLAGFRTFPLITMFGTLCGLLGLTYGPWIPALGFASILVLAILGNLMAMRNGKSDPGVTTEVALILMYAVGAYLVIGPLPVGIAVAGVVAILLHLKPELHDIASRLDRTDVKAIMQFVLVTFVVLPILPNRNYGPLAVFNPFTAWLMVVLIVGISLSGYLIYRFLGPRAGALTGGILGGVVSSTATTVSYSRLAVRSADVPAAFAVVIVMASAVVFGRVLALIGLIDVDFLSVALVPLGLMGIFPALLAVFMWRRVGRAETSRSAGETGGQPRNPTELKTALAFGVIYSGVLLLSAAAKEYWGDRELYLIAGFSGLADVDAITVSTAQLVKAGRVSADQGTEMIVLALVVNTLFKAGITWLFAGWRLFSKILLPLGIAAAAGLVVLAF
ncbi:MAG: MgtC/SapB family protein [Acidobacteria bacterium]|nr:MAG: MgtC/SapB family protein [Acidobacteriota bacterium]